MDPLSAVGLGISGISALSNLLGGSKAEREAQQRRDNIIRQLKQDNAREYLDVISGNQANLAIRTGQLNDALLSTGKSLGAANAAAGVTNSSAVAGSLALGQGNIAKEIANYALRNKLQEQQLLHSGNRQIAGIELGAADQDLGYARDQSQQGLGNFGDFLYGVGQLTAPKPRQQGTSPIDLNAFPDHTLPGDREWGGLLPQPFNPKLYELDGSNRSVLQSGLQSMTQRNRKRVGGIDSRTLGDTGNGYQGAKLPSLGYGYA